MIKTKYPDTVVKGSELFDASLFKESKTKALFYTFMSILKITTKEANPTKTHELIKYVSSRKKLLRCYTQNIDGLEARVGLSLDGKCSQLHGELDHVICTLCPFKSNFDEDIIEIFKDGKSTSCPKCTNLNELRTAAGKRSISIGYLRPNIVLYNEHHKNGLPC